MMGCVASGAAGERWTQVRKLHVVSQNRIDRCSGSLDELDRSTPRLDFRCCWPDGLLMVFSLLDLLWSSFPSGVGGIPQ